MPRVTHSSDTFIAAALTCFIPNLGIIALANVIPDMGAILSVNLLKNGISSNQAKALVIMLQEHLTLKSLCGNKGNETELDMSGKMKGAGDAIMLAPEIADNGALSSLSLATNSLHSLEAKPLLEALEVSGHWVWVPLLCLL